MTALTLNEVILIIGMMIVTFGVRYPVLALVGKMELPPAIIRALRYVPPAVLTAIIFPAVLIQDSQLAIRVDNAYLIAAIVSIVVSWRTKNLLWTILIGMAVFLAWRGLMG